MCYVLVHYLNVLNGEYKLNHKIIFHSIHYDYDYLACFDIHRSGQNGLDFADDVFELLISEKIYIYICGNHNYNVDG